MNKVTIRYSDDWVEIIVNNARVYVGENSFEHRNILDLLSFLNNVEVIEEPIEWK